MNNNVQVKNNNSISAFGSSTNNGVEWFETSTGEKAILPYCLQITDFGQQNNKLITVEARIKLLNRILESKNGCNDSSFLQLECDSNNPSPHISQPRTKPFTCPSEMALLQYGKSIEKTLKKSDDKIENDIVYFSLAI